MLSTGPSHAHIGVTRNVKKNRISILTIRIYNIETLRYIKHNINSSYF